MSAPIEEIRLPFSKVKCAIFQDTYNGDITYSYKFQKSYKDKDTGEWKNTEYYNMSDLRDLLGLVTFLVMKQVIGKQVAQKKTEEHSDDLGF